ncbi:MAG: hypothetical protein O3A15_06360 [Proteobacteria bacterium]|nr:hypothetical protein [Pseudomonadota bacterium]
MANLPNMNAEEINIFSQIANSEADGPVLMINLNKYVPEADYPKGKLYKDYMEVLDTLRAQVGARILWRTQVLGRVVGTQDIDEAIGIWYPNHQAFLDLMTAPASSENMRLRSLAVKHADLHRCAPEEPNMNW